MKPRYQGYGCQLDYFNYLIDEIPQNQFRTVVFTMIDNSKLNPSIFTHDTFIICGFQNDVVSN